MTEIVRDHAGNMAFVAWLPLAAVSIVAQVRANAEHALQHDPKNTKAKKCLKAISWIEENVPVRPAARTYHDHMFMTLNPTFKREDVYAVAGVSDWVMHPHDGVPTHSMASIEEFQHTLNTADAIFKAFKEMWTFDQSDKAFVTIHYSLGGPQLLRQNKVFKKFLSGEYVLDTLRAEERMGARQMYALFTSLTFTDTSEREILQEGYVTASASGHNTAFSSILGPLSAAKLFANAEDATQWARVRMQQWPLPYIHVVGVEVAPTRVVTLLQGSSYIGNSMEPSNNEILERVCAQQSATALERVVGAVETDGTKAKPPKM